MMASSIKENFVAAMVNGERSVLTSAVMFNHQTAGKSLGCRKSIDAEGVSRSGGLQTAVVYGSAVCKPPLLEGHYQCH